MTELLDLTDIIDSPLPGHQLRHWNDIVMHETDALAVGDGGARTSTSRPATGDYATRSSPHHQG